MSDINIKVNVNIKKFPKAVADKLRYYVYLYIDPETDDVFYVGKGLRNRGLSHLAGKGGSALAATVINQLAEIALGKK